MRAPDGLAERVVPENQVADGANFLGYQLTFLLPDQELNFSGSCEVFERNIWENLL